jgi:hypothetical protein
MAPRFGLHQSRPIVLRLSALFMLDTFGSGLVVQSFLAYWLHRRFAIDAAVIGSIFFGMNLLAAFSALVAGRLAKRFGLINTMVWTHIPASLLLISLPWMPSLTLAIAILLLRGCLSQMDVPARQSFVMAVVPPEERTAAVRRGRRHRAGQEPRQRDLTADHRRVVCRGLDERTLRRSGIAEDHLRPGAVAKLPRDQAAGGAVD